MIWWRSRRKVSPNLLSIADRYILLQLRWRAEVAIYFLSDKHRLQGCKTKDNTGCKKAVHYGKTDLYWWGVSIVLTGY